MQTKVELAKDGTRTIFHRTATAAWTHNPGEKYRYWTRLGPQAGNGKDRWGWIEMPCDCPSEFTSRPPQSVQGVDKKAG